MWRMMTAFEFKMGDVIAEIGGRHKFFVCSGFSSADGEYYNLVTPECPHGYGNFIRGDKDYIESHYVKVGKFEDWEELDEGVDRDGH